MTVCLLNWKRADNVRLILDSLEEQTERPQVFLWDNSELAFADKRIDWLVRSSRNAKCWPRWWMASQADTDYVMSLDDDLVLADQHVIKHMVDFMDLAVRHPEPYDRIYGLEGVQLQSGLLYSGSLGKDEVPTGDVDVVKGRFMLLRREALTDVGLHWGVTEDDIAISGLLAKGRRRHHRRMTWLWEYVRALPDPHALCGEATHWQRRDAAVKAFFPWYVA